MNKYPTPIPTTITVSMNVRMRLESLQRNEDEDEDLTPEEVLIKILDVYEKHKANNPTI